MKYLLGIDIGTSGTKTVLFDDNLNSVAEDLYEYPLYQPKNGWAEQNPQDWYIATITTIKNVIKKSDINPEDIASIGLSGQMHGLVMLDDENKVIRPAIIWCDQRTGAECNEITQLVGKERLIDITANPALTGFTASKIMWVKNNEPENYNKCRHILLPKDYIRFMLTGEYATDVSDASGMQLLDVPNRCWSAEILNKLGISNDLLGKVYESVEITGYITKEISQLTGLSTKTCVVGGAGDNAAAAIGTGVVKEGQAFTTIGTSGVVYAHTSKPQIDKLGRVHTFCCAVPGCWHVMGVTQGAGLSLKWFKDNFCYDIIEEANRQNINVYKLIDNMVDNVTIGAEKLIYLPYLMGERTPHLDADCRGVFFGLSAIHTQAHLLRAVMEGVSYSLTDCKNILNAMNINIDNMMACGGGGTSSVWRQMLADMYNCRVSTVNTSQGPALGVAILAGVGCGMFESVEKACEKYINIKNVCEPKEENTKIYNEYYRLYDKLYNSLKDDFKILAQL